MPASSLDDQRTKYLTAARRRASGGGRSVLKDAALRLGALLARVARRVADAETVRVAQRIAGEERAAGQRIRSPRGETRAASLREQSLGPR